MPVSYALQPSQDASNAQTQIKLKLAPNVQQAGTLPTENARNAQKH
jgi:hypothetical protein